MSIQLNNDGSLSITAYSLVELLPEVIQATKDGFALDLDKNEGVPQTYGTLLTLTMYPVKKAVAQKVSEVPVEASQDELAVKVDGRKKKV